jgi:signal transduction histidine kinase
MADSLLASCNNFFEESQLERFKGSFNNFIYSAKRKVEEEIRHSDLLHVLVKSNSEAVESIFNLTASSFNIGNDTRMLGILLIEITKSIKEELGALERFKESLISALSHELNNPMNSLIPLLKIMKKKITKKWHWQVLTY